MVVKRRVLGEAIHIQVLTGTSRYSGPGLGQMVVSLHMECETAENLPPQARAKTSQFHLLIVDEDRNLNRVTGAATTIAVEISHLHSLSSSCG
jgi:hypothetical protein